MSHLHEPTYEPTSGFSSAPESEEEWRETYDWREDAYLLEPYSAGVQKAEHVFRAFDDSGNEIEQTRRMFRHWQFIVDTDAAALASDPVLETVDTGGKVRAARAKGRALDDTLLTLGERVWARSDIVTDNGMWALETCKLGDWWLEAVRLNATPPYRTVIVGYDPRIVTPTYDAATGKQLESVTIDFGLMSGSLEGRRMPGIGGLQTPDAVISQYRRVIDREGVRVTINGKEVKGETGPHSLGEVPMVHLRCLPLSRPEHSLAAPEGIARLLLKCDGLATQNFAIGNRYGNPMLVLYGMKVGAGTDATRFGRFIDGAPVDARAEFTVAGEGILPHLLEQQRELLAHIEKTAPEFVFAADAANESGTARNMRTRSFALKIGRMQRPYYAALSRITAMAVAMDGGPGYEPDAVPFKVDLPPIVPTNMAEELDNLGKVKPDLRKGDYIRHLQRLGYVDIDEDPDLYAAEVGDENAHRATRFFTGGGKEDGAGGEEGSEAAAAPPVAEAPKAYNGIQITSANGILDRVAAGVIQPELGTLELVKFLLVPEADAAEMVRLAQLGGIEAARALVGLPAGGGE